MNIHESICKNDYPGRGIFIGKSSSDEMVIAYFIMGRSPNSRNRIFERRGGNLAIRIFDDNKASDTSLILYTPLRTIGDKTIITNGDHTDTIHNAISKGGSFEDALNTRKFEPDAPNFTPRISGLVSKDSYVLSILKSGDPDGMTCCRQFFNYEPIPGIGHLIHTYKCAGSPLPSFCGEPLQIEIKEKDIDSFSNSLWSGLNSENKVSLYVRWTSKSGHLDKIFNVNDSGE